MTAAAPLHECVINVSEGRDGAAVAELAGAAGSLVLDVHSDADHNRSVITLAGPPAALQEAVRAVATRTVERFDLHRHEGAHPRFGVLDVVPFVPLTPSAPAGMAAIVAARDGFAAWAGEELGLPCFLYGPERTLPEVRRLAFAELQPDAGPPRPHPTAGACAVGARPVMVAWNLWLAGVDLARARSLAADLRDGTVRTMAFELAGSVQLSFNLLSPLERGPAQLYRAVIESGVEVARAELVGLAPVALLDVTPAELWSRLDLDRAHTIEGHLGARTPGDSDSGLDPDQPTPTR